jgi:magnesium transporter
MTEVTRTLDAPAIQTGVPTDTTGDAGSPIRFETAAHHASMAVPIVTPDQTVGEVLSGLPGRRYDSASHVVVCEAARFLGIATIEALLAAPATRAISAVMDHDAPVVAPGVDQEIAAWHAVRKGESALSVVDAQGRFIGLIPPHNLLAVLLAEHEEDLSRLGGFIRSASAARTASQEPVERRFVHRVPWLIVGLAGALMAADVVGWFEHQLEVKVLLAFFIPGIVYLADAVGTQTETVIVRGLSVGVPMRRMVRRELLTGIAIGIVLAAVAAPFVWWRWADPEIALTVGIAIFAACSTATITAMTLPWLLSRSGADPAFGSGPLATVIQDLLSIVIYFGVALALVT